MSVRANFADIYLRGMRDRSMRSGAELAREIQLTDWSTAGRLSNRSSGVQLYSFWSLFVLYDVQLNNNMESNTMTSQYYSMA